MHVFFLLMLNIFADEHCHNNSIMQSARVLLSLNRFFVAGMFCGFDFHKCKAK